MTKIKVGKNGRIGYMVGIMPNPTVKGGYGKKAIVLYVVDPKSMNCTGGGRYVMQQALMKDVEIVDKFPWEKKCVESGKDSGSAVENKSVSATKKNVPRKNSRWEASKEFAAMPTKEEKKEPMKKRTMKKKGVK